MNENPRTNTSTASATEILPTVLVEVVGRMADVRMEISSRGQVSPGPGE
jgi:hypothetical protein